MKSGVKEIELTKYDDLFKDEDTRQDEKLERIQIIPADQIFPYARQPYSIDRATPDLAQLMESIERVGISEPLIARPREGSGYEIISGHRRDYCAKKLGIPDRPVIVRQYTDEEADITKQLAEKYEREGDAEAAVDYYKKALYRYINRKQGNSVKEIWTHLVSLIPQEIDFFYHVQRKISKIMGDDRSVAQTYVAGQPMLG